MERFLAAADRCVQNALLWCQASAEGRSIRCFKKRASRVSKVFKRVSNVEILGQEAYIAPYTSKGGYSRHQAHPLGGGVARR